VRIAGHRQTVVALVAALLAGGALAGAAASAVPSAGRPVAAAKFSPGSCIAFAPSRGHRRRTVFLDAGHGGLDSGAVGVTTTGHPVHEADETLRVALDALAPLRAAGYRVVLSRTTAASVARPVAGDVSGGVFTGQGVHRDLIARDECANDAHASVLIGIYFNASSSPSTSGGLALYDAARPFWRHNLRLAQAVQRGVLASLRHAGHPVLDDGVHTDVGYGSAVTNADHAYGHLLIIGPAKPGYFASPSTMPGVLFEPLFITNPSEASLIDSAAGQRAIAGGIRSAVEAYFAVR
jgi:N-acetylmuramoyl-L-alanine amidase